MSLTELLTILKGAIILLAGFTIGFHYKSWLTRREQDENEQIRD